MQFHIHLDLEFFTHTELLPTVAKNSNLDLY